MLTKQLHGADRAEEEDGGHLSWLPPTSPRAVPRFISETPIEQNLVPLAVNPKRSATPTVNVYSQRDAVALGRLKTAWSLRGSVFDFKHMHTYIHTHIHTYIHTYMHIYMHTYIHIWGWVNTPCCRGAPPPSVTNPCRAGFVTNLCRTALLYDGTCCASRVAKTHLCYKLCRARGAPALLQSRRF